MLHDGFEIRIFLRSFLEFGGHLQHLAQDANGILLLPHQRVGTGEIVLVRTPPNLALVELAQQERRLLLDSYNPLESPRARI